ncbi:MAG: Wadjet anti-phage system protein JetD domain-containing protein [Oscillospiraceae bacterium]
MDNESVILNKLLDKFEDRTPGSNHRVRIVFDKSDIKIPDIESSEYRGFREDMLHLKSRGFIELDWTRKDYLINSVWLNLENVDTVYEYLERENRAAKVNRVIELIDKTLGRMDLDWLRAYLLSSREYMRENNKLTGVWGREQSFLNNFLSALVGINDLHGSSISMRAFSVNIYSDSKFFEREMKSFVITVIKNNEPDLKDIDDISDREALAQVGIIMMSEIFEFCGNVRINFVGGTVDFSPIQKGACVLDESVSEIESIDIFDTDRIIFIENKTNYSEYCLNSRTERELVVYHGGFYSPKHGEFFRKLCEGKNIPTYLWSDIDYGGFRMYMRLKKNIVPSLEPLNMDIGSFERYKEKGLKRDDKYIMTLQKLTEDPDYSVFYDVIAAISDSKVTVEQESFLENELILN